MYIAVDIIQTLEIGVGLPQYYCQIGYQATRVETAIQRKPAAVITRTRHYDTWFTRYRFSKLMHERQLA